MKAAFSTQISSHSSSKQPTTRSTWDEQINNFSQDQLNSYSIEMKKDSNETISDSEQQQEGEEQGDTQVKGDLLNCSNSALANDIDQTKERGRWTEEEHQRFLEGLLLYSNNWQLIHKFIKTRSATQARSHAQKFFIKIRKNITDSNDFGKAKEILYSIFQKHLNKELLSESQQMSLDKITHLILSEENLSKRKFNESMKIRIPLMYLNRLELMSNSVQVNDNCNGNCNDNGIDNKNIIINNRNVITHVEHRKKKPIFNIRKVQRENSQEMGNPLALSFDYNPHVEIEPKRSIREDDDFLRNFGIQTEVNKVAKCDPFKLEFEDNVNDNNNNLIDYENGVILFPSLNLFN